MIPIHIITITYFFITNGVYNDKSHKINNGNVNRNSYAYTQLHIQTYDYRSVII